VILFKIAWEVVELTFIVASLYFAVRLYALRRQPTWREPCRSAVSKGTTGWRRAGTKPRSAADAAMVAAIWVGVGLAVSWWLSACFNG